MCYHTSASKIAAESAFPLPLGLLFAVKKCLAPGGKVYPSPTALALHCFLLGGDFGSAADVLQGRTSRIRLSMLMSAE